MACFLAPLATAIVTTGIRKKIPQNYHFNWLIWMLWGGSLMLIVEHIAHEEIVPYPPFLTRGLPEVLPEILKIGVPMTLFIFLVWIVMVSLSLLRERKRILST